MSIEDNNVPYEDHVIPNNDVGGASGLSGLFDMAGEITKDAVGLTKAIASDAVQLGQEIADMAKSEPSPQEQDRVDRLAWAEEQRQQFMEHKSQTQDRDFSR